jgi:hypothetical protein
VTHAHGARRAAGRTRTPHAVPLPAPWRDRCVPWSAGCAAVPAAHQAAARSARAPLQFGRWIHTMRRLLDFALIALLAVETFDLKTRPEDITTFARSCATASLILMAIIVEEEIRTVLNVVRNSIALLDVEHGRMSTGVYARIAVDFLIQHNVHVQLLAYALAVVGACIILGVTGLSTDQFRTTHIFGTNGSDAAYKSTVLLADPLRGTEIVDEGDWAWLWLVQGLAMLLLVVHFMTIMFQPFEQLSILSHSMSQMVRRDVSVYLTVFLCLFAGFFLALYIIYPRSGEHTLPHVPSFNTVHTAVLDMLRLSILGESTTIYPITEAFDAMGTAQVVCGLLWLLLYFMWQILSVILMINLLIAMLTNTFEDVREEATLMSRLSFAIAIMKLEIVAQSFSMSTAVGEPMPGGAMVHVFRSVNHRKETFDAGDEDNYELAADEGGTDPFQPPPHSETRYYFDKLQQKIAELETKLEQKPIVSSVRTKRSKA